jgi:hypothetical protein
MSLILTAALSIAQQFRERDRNFIGKTFSVGGFYINGMKGPSRIYPLRVTSPSVKVLNSKIFLKF